MLARAPLQQSSYSSSRIDVAPQREQPPASDVSRRPIKTGSDARVEADSPLAAISRAGQRPPKEQARTLIAARLHAWPTGMMDGLPSIGVVIAGSAR